MQLEHALHLNATSTILGLSILLLIILAYIIVILEELSEIKKSKPVLLAAGITWILVMKIAKDQNMTGLVLNIINKNLLGYVELLLFLIVAITYINSLEQMQVFNSLRIWLLNKRFNLKQLFWITGLLAFFISPVADNLTTALLMSTIIMSVAPGNKKFICCASINIVVAANAGGAFSPFGDLTTLMVWQANKVPFIDFFKLFIPAIISFIIPAILMSFTIEDVLPPASVEKIQLQVGAKRVLILFILTIMLSVFGNHYLHLPPVIGMMTGLGMLTIFGFYLKKKNYFINQQNKLNQLNNLIDKEHNFDIFKNIKNLDWDTLLFFYGIMMCIGSLEAVGYLHQLSEIIYSNLGNNLITMHRHTPANVIIGLLSAIIDNIPLMFAVIAMDPIMVKGQWLLVTLTLGIGGSLLSIGSAAGVAIMGSTKGAYSFLNHLKWSWAILLGYIAAIYTHVIINKNLF